MKMIFITFRCFHFLPLHPFEQAIPFCYQDTHTQNHPLNLTMKTNKRNEDELPFLLLFTFNTLQSISNSHMTSPPVLKESCRMCCIQFVYAKNVEWKRRLGTTKDGIIKILSFLEFLIILLLLKSLLVYSIIQITCAFYRS